MSGLHEDVAAALASLPSGLPLTGVSRRSCGRSASRETTG